MEKGGKDPKASQIELAKRYDENIAIRLPLAWDWDKRYFDSLPYMFSFSVAVTSLDCKIGDLILDFASGSGWVSEWLNRLGYKTVSMDISTILLGFGKKRLSCDSRIDLDEIPAYFVAGDGEMIPFKDEVFDGIICMNSLHHMPDYQVILNEMFRVLKKHGRAAFAEPGSEHSKSKRSVMEMEESGVLEREVILSDIYDKALKSDFKELYLKPYFYPAAINFPYFKWQRFLNKTPNVVNEYLDNICDYVEKSNLIFTLHKSLTIQQKDSRLPGILMAEIKIIEIPKTVLPEGIITIRAEVRNIGDTLWVSAPNRFGGYITLGVKLLDGEGEVIENDFGRGLLPKDIMPGESTEVSVSVKAPREKGRYALKLNMVCEKITWFETVGSKPLIVGLEVV